MLLLPAFFAALLIHEGALGRNGGYGRWERLGVREFGLARDFDVIPVGRRIVLRPYRKVISPQ